MVSRFDDYLGALTDISDVDAIWDATAELSYAYGFSGCSLVLGERSNGKVVTKSAYSSLSPEFEAAYAQENLAEIDPFLLFTCTRMNTQKIVTKDMSSFPNATLKHKLFMDHAAENGAISNLGVPVRTNDNDIFGGWIFSHKETEKQFDLLEKDHGRNMHLASVLAYERMVALGLGTKEQHDLLSERERECLLWLCVGLRVALIADKLNISDSAVNLYIANAKRKLGAKTREQAVARAIFSGEINL